MQYFKSLTCVLLLTFLSACAPVVAPDASSGAQPAAEAPAAEEEAHEHDMTSMDELGTVEFAISCTPEAQTEFNHAVALLHSFWFAPAIESFNTVSELDPTCAMGHWGVAMSLLGNPFAWPLAGQALTDGWAAVEQAMAAETKSPREEAYIAAIAEFYRDAANVDHRTRALAYRDAMAQLAADYPEDTEATIFYALALAATADPTDKTYANQLQAVEMLEAIFVDQPEHPGIAHYLIHNNDYPALAQHGLDAALRYSEIAPDAPHALHMPSHIFTRLGYWQESIEVNSASAAAAQNELSATHEQGAGSYNALHAMDYLMYAYLQLGQDQAAEELLGEVNAIEALDVVNFAAAYAFAAMPARYALERGDWEAAANLTLHPQNLAWEKFPQAEAVMVFARAYGAARSGDVAAAQAELTRMEELQAAMVEMNQGYWASQADIQMEEIRAWIALAEGNQDEAVELMRNAVAMEAATEKHPVTPGPIVPAHELLGEMLLELEQPAEALAEFEASHEVEPNRFRGLYGAAHAAELAGETDKATTYYTELVELASTADTERAEVVTAQEFLAQ